MAELSQVAEIPTREPVCRLMLFVAGGEPHSSRARENLDQICARCEPGTFEIQIIDVLENYRVALDHNILVTPSLLMLEPSRILIAGSLDDFEKVRTALQLPRGNESTND